MAYPGALPSQTSIAVENPRNAGGDQWSIIVRLRSRETDLCPIEPGRPHRCHTRPRKPRSERRSPTRTCADPDYRFVMSTKAPDNDAVPKSLFVSHRHRMDSGSVAVLEEHPPSQHERGLPQGQFLTRNVLRAKRNVPLGFRQMSKLRAAVHTVTCLTAAAKPGKRIIAIGTKASRVRSRHLRSRLSRVSREQLARARFDVCGNS